MLNALSRVPNYVWFIGAIVILLIALIVTDVIPAGDLFDFADTAPSAPVR